MDQPTRNQVTDKNSESHAQEGQKRAIVDLSREPVPQTSIQKPETPGVLPELKVIYNGQQIKPSCTDTCNAGERYVPTHSTAAYAREMFTTIDTNNDGYLNIEELQDFERRAGKSLNPEESKHLKELIGGYRTFKSLSNDELGFEPTGISKNDIEEARKIEMRREHANDIKKIVEKHFGSIDQDRDKNISPAEIEAYVKAHPELSSSELRALETLKSACYEPALSAAGRGWSWSSFLPGNYYGHVGEGLTQTGANLTARVAEGGYGSQ